MQKVIYISEIQDYTEYIEQSVVDYINDGQIETYERFENYDFIAFDWYDIINTEKEPAQILIYIDEDDLFFICENETSYTVAEKLFTPNDSNELALYTFFRNLFKDSPKYLEKLENQLSELDETIIKGTNENQWEQIIDLRNEILRMKKYYEQLDFIFDEICDEDNDLISNDYLQYFEILQNRSIRLLSQVLNLREYVAQVRESYQSQIGIEQNNLMKVFTLVTSIFMPLTLIVGWYGMNVKMPEFDWKYGYLFVIGLCLISGLLWFVIFKKKHLFK